MRADIAALENIWHDANTRFIPVWNSRFVVRDERAVLLTLQDIGTNANFADSIYLGQQAATHLFAIALPEEPAGPELGPAAFDNFRGLMGELPDEDAALLAYAKGMVEWQNRHRHCGMCGAVNILSNGGFAMDCSNTECGNRSFPRIDPAIIVLVSDGEDKGQDEDKDEGERCLLGRQQSWPEGRYSTLAGFVEPGESLEDAVRREVKEESDIDVAVEDVVYQGSQPWPFPTGMMVGFHATASSTAIHLNDGELAQ